jgi:hypothetical protein
MFIILPYIKTHGVSIIRYTLPKLHNVKRISIVGLFETNIFRISIIFTSYMAVNPLNTKSM